MFEVVCYASIFRRRVWNDMPEESGSARAEGVFRALLTESFGESDVSRSLKDLVPRVEQWLVANRADLVNDTVVTVYSVEAVDDPKLDPGPTPSGSGGSSRG